MTEEELENKTRWQNLVVVRRMGISFVLIAVSTFVYGLVFQPPADKYASLYAFWCLFGLSQILALWVAKSTAMWVFPGVWSEIAFWILLAAAMAITAGFGFVSAGSI